MSVVKLLLTATLALPPAAAAPAHLHATAPVQEPGVVEIPRIEAEIRMDGSLDEPVWERAARLTGFSQYEPVDGRPAEERTEVLVWYAPDAIHFGIRAYDSQPDAIRATQADRDNIDDDDNVVLYLDTFNDRRRAFFFAVNPLGVQRDGVRTEGAGTAGNIFGGNIDESPDFFYDSKGRVTEDGYVVEVRIPFKSLRYPTEADMRWGFQVVRNVRRTGHSYTWTAARRGRNSFLVQAGTLTGLRDLRRGVVLEAQPFLTAEATGAREGGAFRRSDIEPDVGLNLRLGFTSLSLDATINPDFSQVESDIGQVTQNERFALFFPEKRPFFLEGIELFSTPNQLVYTRQIANPIAGGKVSGKLGALNIAHLTAVDEATSPGTPDALYNVTRLRLDFGANSAVGGVVTDRQQLDSDGFNRVAAVDARVVFADLYYVEAQVGQSWTEAGEDPLVAPLFGASRSTVQSAPIWQAELDRTGHTWGFNYELGGVGEEFLTRSGFVPRSGIIDGHAFNRLRFYGAPGALAEELTVFFGPSRLWRYGSFGAGDAIEGGESVNSTLRLRGGWELSLRMTRDFVAFEPEAFAGFATVGPTGPVPYLPLEETGGPGLRFEFDTPVFTRLDAEGAIARSEVAIFAEGSAGDAARAEAELSLRPSRQIRLSARAVYERITRQRDGSEFARSLIPRIKAEYQPTRALFFRAIGEWRSERRSALQDARTGAPLLFAGRPAAAFDSDDLRLDLLASYEPTPGTVAFLGYGSSLAALDPFAFRDLERTADGFFLKIAYQLRR